MSCASIAASDGWYDAVGHARSSSVILAPSMFTASAGLFRGRASRATL
jgi:hypothetical protein